MIAGIRQDLLEGEPNRKGRLVVVRSRNYLCARGDSVPSETCGDCQHRAATQDVEGDGRYSLEVELQFCSSHIDSVPHVVVAGKKALRRHCRSDQRVIGVEQGSDRRIQFGFDRESVEESRITTGAACPSGEFLRVLRDLAGVRGRFGRDRSTEHVVVVNGGRTHDGSAGQVDFDDLRACAQRSEGVHQLGGVGGNVRINRPVTQRGDHGDTHSCQRMRCEAGQRRCRYMRGNVSGGRSRDDRLQCEAITYGASHRTAVAVAIEIEGRINGDTAVRWLEPDNSVERRRSSDRTCNIGTGSQVRHTGGKCDCRSTGRPAGGVFRVPRIASDAPQLGLCERGRGEFGCRRSRVDDGTGVDDSLHESGSVSGDHILIDLGPLSPRLSLHRFILFHHNGNTGERKADIRAAGVVAFR